MAGEETSESPAGNGAEPVYGPAARTAAQAGAAGKSEGPGRSGISGGSEGPAQPFADGVSPPYTAPYPPYPSDVPEPPGMPMNVAFGLAYFVVPAVFFLLLPRFRGNTLLRFHSWQAIFYFLAVAAVRVVDLMIAALLPSAVAFTISGLLMLLLFAGWLVATVRAFQGGRVFLPAIGSMADTSARSVSGRI